MAKVFWESLKQNLKTQIEYRSSFIMALISQMAVFFSYYFVIIALFQKFGNVKGFTVYEVLLCFSIIQIGFAMNETFFRGMDKFDGLIINGTLDRLLLRPQNVILQVLCTKMDLLKILRVIQGIIILILALIKIKIVWTFIKVLVLIMMLISSVVIFFGLFVLMAAYCFKTVQGLEVKNLMTDGGKYMAQYPIGIFRKGFVFIFSFIIPYASVNYYPLLYLLGKSTKPIYALSPLLVFIFIIPCLYAFKIGLKRYTSTGS